jgi:hypothetical protein
VRAAFKAGASMKNVTITLDEQTVEWAKLAAATAGKSLSRFVGDVLEGHLSEARQYERAMQAWLDQKSYIPLESGKRVTMREEIYAERLRLR